MVDKRSAMAEAVKKQTHLEVDGGLNWAAMKDVGQMGAGLAWKEGRGPARARANTTVPVEVEARPGLPSTRLRRWIL